MADSDTPGRPASGWVPVPDPTALTTEAVEKATGQYRRELDGLRELLSERISTAVDERIRSIEALQGLIEQRLAEMDQARAQIAADVRKTLPDYIDGRVTSLRELLEQRLGGMDRATELLASDLRQVPTSVEGSIVALRELMESKLAGLSEAVRLQTASSATLPAEIRTEIAHLQQLHEERFSSIAQQFSERDIRTDQASKAAKEALDAALQAAKELVNAQGEASSAAAVKSETSFTKQIDQIGTIISTLEKALDARITELKERIDRGEGSTSGVAVQRTDQRASIGTVIAAVATLAAVISFVLLVVRK